MSLFSGIAQIVVGAAELAAAAAIFVGSGGIATPLAVTLATSGAGMIISGAGTLIAGTPPVPGVATTTRSSISPWRVCYGRCRVGGTVVYMHEWGTNNQMLDMVIVLAAHACQSIDALLFDMQRVQIDTTAAPAGALSGSGTSFTPVQQTIPVITSIARDSHGVVTVQVPSDIPYLIPGDLVIIKNVAGDATLNGKFPVASITNAPSTHIGGAVGLGTNLTFTILNGGTVSTVTNSGQVVTTWADYGRNVYFEPLLGAQTLGHTFIGMGTPGTPWQGTGGPVSPNLPGAAGAAINPQNNFGGEPNPWTAYCSLQGKTAVFLRIKYDPKYFTSGLPQISFLLHGKNDIYDPRSNSYGYSENAALCIADYLNQGDTTDGRNRVKWGFGAAYGTDIPDGISTTIASSIATGSHTVTPASMSGIAVGATLLVANSDGSDYEQIVVTATTGTTFTATFASSKTGPGITVSTALSAAANICDGRVTLAEGGTEPRYALNGTFELTSRRGEILQNLLTACAGRIVYLGGQYTIQPGAWYGSSPASVNLTSMAAGPYRWRPTVSMRDLYNGCKGTYISPDNKWQSSDFPYYAQDTQHGYSGPGGYDGDANLAADGGDRRWLELHLPFTISSSTAQRIAKIELLRRRHGGSGTFPLNMAGYQFAPLDVLSATVAFLGWSGKILEVGGTRFRVDENGGKPLLGTEIDVQETDSSIYQWATTEELSSHGYVQSNFPTGTFQETAPLPWSPGYVSPLAGDAIGGAATFGIQPAYGYDAQGNQTAGIQIKGTPPINAIDTDVAAPLNSCASSTTGGSIPPGTYVVGLTAHDSGAANYADTDYQTLAVLVVGGSGSGSITVTPTWGSGDDGGDLYMGIWTPAGAVMHYQQTLAPGATSAIITSFNESTAGGPDPLFDHFGVEWLQEIHGGVWAQQIEAVTPTTITIGGNGMTVNQWAGYTLSLLSKYDFTVEVPVINMPVASNTASSGGLFTLTIGPNSSSVQLPDLTTLLAVNDLVVMRAKCTFSAAGTSTTIAANIATGSQTVMPASMTGIATGSVLVVANSDGSHSEQVVVTATAGSTFTGVFGSTKTGPGITVNSVNAFTDPNFANPYYPTGDSQTEAGHVAIVLTGADAGDIQTIASVTADGSGNNTVFNLAGPWATTPAAGDIVVVCAPAAVPEWTSPAMSVRNSSIGAMSLQPNVQNLGFQTWLFLVRTEDANGNAGPDVLAPMRDVYLFGSGGTRSVSS